MPLLVSKATRRAALCVARSSSLLVRDPERSRHHEQGRGNRPGNATDRRLRW
jgi:hypothetical protein